MRILDQDTDRKLDRVLLCLTPEEARELRDSMDALIETPENNHAHVPDSGFVKEITVCVYGDSLEGFDERVRTLIEHDR